MQDESDVFNDRFVSLSILPQPDARASTVLGDELDAGGFDAT